MKFLQLTQWLFSGAMLVSFSASADLLEITATKPFPDKVAATTQTLATFTVTNISEGPVTPVDISRFPRGSGLSVASSDCTFVLAPQASCTMELLLEVEYICDQINAALEIWAKPSLDVVRYPIHVRVTENVPSITLEEIPALPSQDKLPAFREPLVALHGGKWLILSGSYGNFHDFENDFNTDIYVYDPKEQKIKSVLIADTDLPDDVRKQLSSSVPVFLQDGDTLHIIGGYYQDKDTNTYTTLNTVTLVDIPGMTKAVQEGKTDLKQFIAYCSDNTATPCPDYFKVTGGQLGKIGHSLYLTFGQDCEGRYCSGSQVYTNAIYQFIAIPDYDNNTVFIRNIDSVVHHDNDGSGFRRRDFSLTPFKWYGKDSLLALAGPFTPGRPANVWTNGIIFDKDMHYDTQFISQQGNQYAVPHLPMYSEKQGTAYVATFSGLSNLYWSTDGLVYDNTTPYGNILDLISADETNHVNEYVNLTPMCNDKPLERCLYNGLAAAFIPVEHYYDERDMLLLDKLPKRGKTLVGYVYGGLLSTTQEPFSEPDETYVTNQVYGVYVEPSAEGAVYWQNVTNAYTQN